ncbi:MAG: polysaccharide biosynthesis C-terminal domain-containing protein, partial [Ginsengibacter sp.]
FIIALGSIVISLCSNYLFIRSMGALGASISVCCSYFVVLILVLLFTKNFWKPMLYGPVA